MSAPIGRGDSADLPFRAIADDTYDWESWLSPFGQVLWVNRAVERITGHAPSACLAMHKYPLPLVMKEDRKPLAQVLSGALRGSAGNDLEFRIRRTDGEPRWVAMSWQSSRDDAGQVLGIRLSIRDIHRRKQLELELADALQRAQAADRAKTEFLAMVSHELRTPLQCIAGYTQLLTTQAPRPEQDRHLRVIADQNAVMLQLLDSILDLSAADLSATGSHAVRTDLGALARETHAAFSSQAQQRGLSLNLAIQDDVQRSLWADAGAIHHVLRNLLSNALKFTADGHVELALRVQRDSGDNCKVTFTVSDTGPGIPAESRARIFAPFVQLDRSPTREHGGIGLGLAIAERFTERLGGKLELLETQVGASFQLAFVAPSLVSPNQAQPLCRQSASVGASEPALGERLAQELRVLVADDSQPSRLLTCEWLRVLGQASVAVADGQAAIEQAKRQPFDLLLIDLQMPTLGGEEVARQLREQAIQEHSYIVALTAHRFAAMEPAVVSAGFDEVLVKPLPQQELMTVLRHARHRYQLKSYGHAVLPPSPALAAQVVDELWAYAVRDDGPTLLHRLGRQVLRAQYQLLPLLSGQLQRHDFAGAARSAHEIKGNCALVGGHEAAERAGDLIDALSMRVPPNNLTGLHHALLRSLLEFACELRSALAVRPQID